MTQRLQVHPDNPQLRLLRQAAQVLRDGGLVATPTDACYVLTCHLNDKDAVQRLRAVREIDEKHLLTLMCSDLSELATYAKVYDKWWPELEKRNIQQIKFSAEDLAALRAKAAPIHD